ncbi:serine hydrolase domain-containing protein [Hymenobacter weizhouensis]|uniref:serine hydrolase domain-containing protein n=1 Tax=Hymenobacter sp. YIM 151500-1 TaxID=2987689 RepID=UPI002227632F|nr:serine hydrolase [Hymenobacter sp. YIM 151500-1]UYZ64451.1 beta-lactamase family protein [Hymenobacter sp. YIM 151500-1]
MPRLLLALAGFVLLFVLSACHVGRFFIYNFADIRDWQKFPVRPVERGAGPVFRFFEPAPGSPSAIRLPQSLTLHKGERRERTVAFDDVLRESGTVAFLVIRHDSLLVEKYLAGYDAASVVPSFSVAKSYVSALVGIAIGEGYIKSVEEPITKYLPELRGEKFQRITIAHVLNMRSGVLFNESYINPFGDAAKYYYGTNLKKYVSRLQVREAPDQHFDYISGNTQLLGLIVARATGRPLAQYLQEKIWQPLGSEYDASWSLDSRRGNTEKAFCCLNARARDFAKLGRLYLRRGEWQGRQLVPRDWVERSVYDVSTTAANDYLYGYQWWHTRRFERQTDTTRRGMFRPVNFGQPKKPGAAPMQVVVRPGPDFYAEGILGQFIYVFPKKDILVVRLGKRTGPVNWANIARDLAGAN